MLLKIFYIMWHDKFSNPFRVLEKSYARYRKNGYSGFRKGIHREYYSLVPRANGSRRNRIAYKKWIEQNERNILYAIPLAKEPLISIITPVYNTDKYYLEQMIGSVVAQTYKNWELCIADDASSDQETLNILDKYEKLPNVKIVYRKENGHIAEASNTALSLASGEYIAFLDHDDMLAPHALYAMVEKINENPQLKFIYSDEDKIDVKGVRYFPHFKSGWNPDMFFSQNYIAHFTMIQTRVIDQIGGFRKGYEGSQDYDLYLRALSDLKKDEIGHVPKVLYHWRAIEGSTAFRADAKPYTTEAGISALKDYFQSQNETVEVMQGTLPNTYRVNYKLTRKPPLVSLLVPTRDGYDILSKCIQSIFDYTIYPSYEIIIIDNESKDPQTLAYLDTLKAHENVTIVEYHKPFNYSAINNFALQYAKGEIVGLFNNDVEIISAEWLTEMVQHALRPEIGAVGAKLYYEDDTVQHAGVILGIGGVAGHSHKYFPRTAYGYFSRLKIVQNLSAVTGACLVVRKSLYEEVGGLDEENLTVAFNDVDFCLKLQERGYRNLWTPYVELYHHESKSRGMEDTPEKKQRFHQEVQFMKQKWGDVLENDLYYNVNLTLDRENFDIAVSE